MRQLSNGLTLIHKRNRGNRIVGLTCMVLTGSVNETAEESGLTNLAFRVMRKGTTTRSARQIDEETEALGISIGDAAGQDLSYWTLVSTVDDFEPALELLADILLHPSFDPKEIENERQQVLAAIRMQEDNKFAFTYKNFRRLLYAGHPYGRPVEGTPESLAGLVQAQMIALHEKQMSPSNMIVAVVGDLDETELTAAIEKRLGIPCAMPARRVTVGKEFVPRPASETLKKKAEQGFLCIGYTTCSIDSPDYPALRIASAVLGEGMSARLFTILRDQQGLAYAVGSSNTPRRQQGHLVAYIGTKPESIQQARDGILTQLDRLKREPVGEEELTRAKNYATGGYLMGHESNANQAYYLAYWQALGMGLDYDTAYPEMLDRVTARDVLRVANKYFLEPTIVTLQPDNGQADPQGESDTPMQ